MRQEILQTKSTRWNGVGSIYFRVLLNVVSLRVSKEALTSFSQEAFIQDEIRNEFLTKQFIIIEVLSTWSLAKWTNKNTAYVNS